MIKPCYSWFSLNMFSENDTQPRSPWKEMHSANELQHFGEPLVHKIASFDTVQEASRILIDMKFNEFTDKLHWFRDRLPATKKRQYANYSSRETMQGVRCAIRKTIRWLSGKQSDPVWYRKTIGKYSIKSYKPDHQVCLYHQVYQNPMT